MDQAAQERVLLALKILTSGYEPESGVTQAEVEELRAHLGDEAIDWPPDQIARTIIQREIKRQDEGQA